MEHHIPIMFDVTAASREEAGEFMVRRLAELRPQDDGPIDRDAGPVVESWWTIEGVDKQFDRNDNDAGLVLFTMSEADEVPGSSYFTLNECFRALRAIIEDGRAAVKRTPGCTTPMGSMDEDAEAASTLHRIVEALDFLVPGPHEMNRHYAAEHHPSA